MKGKFYMFLYQTLGILFSILFIYAGLFLMVHYTSSNIIFGIGLLGNIFGGWALIKILFECPLGKPTSSNYDKTKQGRKVN